MLGSHASTNRSLFRRQDSAPVSSWRAKVPLHIKTKRFDVGICDNASDLWETLQLRADVFSESFPNLSADLTAMDALDHYADVLYVREHETGRIVASYRLIHSKLSPGFYSSEEFDLTSFLTKEGSKLELSRAVVHEDYRNGVVLHLPWRGIAAYMIATSSNYLFGLTSMQTYDLKTILDIYSYLQGHHHIGDDFDVQPRSNHNLLNWHGLSRNLKEEIPQKLPAPTPPLLKAYIHAGAKIYGAPAVDTTFGCFDFFTVLEFDKIAKKHARKYLDGEL